MKRRDYLTITCFLIGIFVLFTVLTKTIDVQFLNQTYSYYLGFHDFNFLIGNLATQFGRYESMQKLSDVLLYISFGYVAIFAIVGVYQLIKRKSFAKVDKELYLLLGSYVTLVIIYFMFEVVKVNYSPDTSEGLKASYPSTHVFIGCSLFLVNTFTALKMINPEKKWIDGVAYAATLVVCILLTLTRSLSLKHWITDIIASIILTGAFYFLYLFVYSNLIKEKETTLVAE